MVDTIVNIPKEMRAPIQRAVIADQLSSEALVLEGVEEHVRRNRLQELYPHEEGEANKVGVEERDVADIVKAGRPEPKRSR